MASKTDYGPSMKFVADIAEAGYFLEQMKSLLYNHNDLNLSELIDISKQLNNLFIAMQNKGE